MSPRAHISLKKKLAAALRELFGIPYEHAKQMTADQIISLVQFDHGILHGVEVNDEHWNLTPRLIATHREKSRKDTSVVAKVVRVERAQKSFSAMMSALIEERRRAREEKKARSRWPNRKFLPSKSRS